MHHFLLQNVSVKYACQYATRADWRPFYMEWWENAFFFLFMLGCQWPLPPTCLSASAPSRLLLSTSAHWENFLCFEKQFQMSHIKGQVRFVSCPFKWLLQDFSASIALITARKKNSFRVQRRRDFVLSGCISVSEGLVVTYCAFSHLFSVQRFFSASIFTVVSLDMYSLLFCIKMKSETKYL